MLKSMLKSKKTSAAEAVTHGFIAGMVEAAYIILVAIFFIIAEAIFPPSSELLVFGAVALIILLVFSAALSLILIFCHPLNYLLAGKKIEAKECLGATMLTLFGAFSLVMFMGITLSNIKF
jgi:hypothetical protein